MPEDPPRQHEFHCVCGNRILFELPSVPAALCTEDERRVLAITSETGARLDRCPRCGTEIHAPVKEP